MVKRFKRWFNNLELVNKLRYKFTVYKVKKIKDELFFDGSRYLRINLGCFGRACYGYVNFDETRTSRRVFVSSFLGLPLRSNSVKRILLDSKALDKKSFLKIFEIFKELERIAVPGCILSIDDFKDDLGHILKQHNFIPVSDGYARVFSVKSFVYRPPCARDDLERFLESIGTGLEKDGSYSVRVPDEKAVSGGSNAVIFYDKASVTQILTENGYYVDRLDVKDSFIEVAFTKGIIVPENKKRICAIGQYMLLKYAQLGFSWDAWSRSFERLGLDYLLIDGMRNLDHKKIQEAILSFRPHYLLVVLKDTLPVIMAIEKELKSIGTRVVYWFCDPEQPAKTDLSSLVDTMFVTNQGQVNDYKKHYNLERVYYMPQGFDPYVQHRLYLPEAYDVGFAGAVSDAPLHKSRRGLIKALQKRYNVRISNKFRNNIAEFYAGSKTVFGASDFDYELYTSNRFFVALGCGACYITKKFKGIELLAGNRKHLLWFEDKQELFDILDYYLSHDPEREEIRKNAESLALEKHTYSHRMKNVLDILEGKTEKFYGFLK